MRRGLRVASRVDARARRRARELYVTPLRWVGIDIPVDRALEITSGADALAAFGRRPDADVSADPNTAMYIPSASGTIIGPPAGGERMALLAGSVPATWRHKLAALPTIGGVQNAMYWASRASTAGYSVKLAQPLQDSFSIVCAFRPMATSIGGGVTSSVCGLFPAASGAGSSLPRAAIRINTANACSATVANDAGTAQNAAAGTLLVNKWVIAALVYTADGHSQLKLWVEDGPHNQIVSAESAGTVDIDAPLTHLMFGLEPQGVGTTAFAGEVMHFMALNGEMTDNQFRRIAHQDNPRQWPLEMEGEIEVAAFVSVQADQPLREWISGRILSFTAGAAAGNMVVTTPTSPPPELQLVLPNRLGRPEKFGQSAFNEAASGSYTLAEHPLGMRRYVSHYDVKFDTGATPNPATQSVTLALGEGYMGCGGGDVKLVVQNTSADADETGVLFTQPITYEKPTYAAMFAPVDITEVDNVAITYSGTTGRTSQYRYVFPTDQADWNGGVVFVFHGRGGTRLDYDAFTKGYARRGYFVIQPDFDDSPLDDDWPDNDHFHLRIAEADELVDVRQSILDLEYTSATATFVGIFGHSLGCNTGQGITGMRILDPDLETPTTTINEAVDFGVYLSSVADSELNDGPTAWATLSTPIFIGTGTDDAAEGGGGYASRLAAIDNSTVEAYSMVLQDGDHGHGLATNTSSMLLKADWQTWTIDVDASIAHMDYQRAKVQEDDALERAAGDWVLPGRWRRYWSDKVVSYDTREAA